jgi:hypothetical protein
MQELTLAATCAGPAAAVDEPPDRSPEPPQPATSAVIAIAMTIQRIGAR